MTYHLKRSTPGPIDPPDQCEFNDVPSRPDVPPPPRWARIAGHVGWIAPIVGFVPLHLPWIFGIPWMAHENSFKAWYHGQGHGSGSYPEAGILGIPAGAMYLGALLTLAMLGGILSLGLIQRWGVVYPHWMPLLRGRRVAPWFPLTPAVLGSLLLVGYSLTLPVQIPRAIANASENDPFTLTGALIGLPILLAWAVALPIATYSYWRRTRRPARPARSLAIDAA